MTDIDTLNKFVVAVSGDGIHILAPPRGGMSTDDALVLAAWLVSLADPLGKQFPMVLKAVQKT